MHLDNTDPTPAREVNSSSLDPQNIQRISAQELHKYVWGLMTIFAAFAVTYPIACWRVSQSEQFRPYQAHIKPLTESYQIMPIKGQ
jgi:hypothetical protein